MTKNDYLLNLDKLAQHFLVSTLGYNGPPPFLFHIKSIVVFVTMVEEIMEDPYEDESVTDLQICIPK